MDEKRELMDEYLKGKYTSKVIGDVLTETVLSSAAYFLTEPVII